MAKDAFNSMEMDALLTKYFSGQASPEEAMLVDDWRLDNEPEFNALWEAWNATTAHPHQTPDTRAAWQQFRPLAARRVRFISMRWAVAAAVLIAVVVSVALLFPHKIRMKTVVAMAGQQLLPDSSLVKIDRGSLTYPARFKGGAREVTLNSGQGRFEIHADPAHPFVLSVPPVKIKVLGTDFYVADSGAVISVQVYSGKVMVYNGQQHIILDGGQTGAYHKKDTLLAVNTASFHFDNQDMGSVTTILSQTFHRKISFKDPAIATMRISSIFDNKSLDYILEVIGTTLNLKYTYLNQDEIVLEEI